MAEDFEKNSNSIKYHIRKFFLKHADRFKGKTIVDMPAGNGVTSRLLKDIGAIPLPFDLFPEYFMEKDVECKRADVLAGIPLEDNSVDGVICQEGIEHFSDQFKALKEFNRIIKPGGSLIITTPNYSNLRSRMSYFLSESERFNKIMPPNEIDSIWMNQQNLSSEIYFGHVFLIGIQKLRVLAKLSGFKIKLIQSTKLKTTSLFLLIFNYPWIWLSNYFTYRKNLKKDKGYDKSFQKEVYKEIFDLSVNFRLLVDGHIFVEFEKEKEANEVFQDLKSTHKEFGIT